MAREEVKYASKDYVNYLLDKQEYHNEKYTEYDIKQAFEKGAEWADTHPKSPWINYKEEKPPFGAEVIAYHHKWVDEDFNPNGTRIGFLSDDGFISAFWLDEQDCYETISKQHCESNRDFYKNYIDNTEPEFWFPIPKFIRIGDKTMETKTININLEEQCLWYLWYNILSARFPDASKSWVVNEVNKIVYKK